MLPSIENHQKDIDFMKQSQQQSMMITQIDKPIEKSQLSFLSRKNYQVYMVEDSIPPTQFPPSQLYYPLPSTVQFERIVANVITSLSTSYFKSIQNQQRGDSSQNTIQKWTRYLKLPQNKALVSDCFWYAICKFFHQGKYLQSQIQLEKRIGKNYIGLFLSIDQKKQGKIYSKQSKIFFKQYFNTLSQSVFYSFFYAFPKSRIKFDDQLKDQLLTVFSQLFTGIQISNKKYFYDKWTLDLGTGNILAKRQKKINNIKDQSQIIKQKIQQLPQNKDRMKKRDTLIIKYSPIVDLYLKNNKYKTRNYVSQFKMKYTQPDKNKQLTQLKFSQYKQEAAKIQQWSNNQKKIQQQRKKQLDQHIKSLKRQTINHHRRLDRRKAQELQRGAHQYANYLVSMLNAGITMTSLGVIRKNPT